MCKWAGLAMFLPDLEPQVKASHPLRGNRCFLMGPQYRL